MPSYIIKPERDRDFYVYWSTVVEAPVAFGDREYILSYLRAELERDSATSPQGRLRRADETGSSALWPSPSDPAYGWDDNELIYQQQGTLRRDRLPELCKRLTGDDHADVSDLLTPFEDGPR
jgi:hypothetical protein